MLFIGTSGWQYRDWRGAFYPQQLPQRLWLDYYAQRFPTAEVNNTFYRLPERKAFENWAETVPADFRMAAKMSRYLTHIKRLQEPAEPVQRFLDRSAGLDGRLGPVLLQLPPNLRAAPDALDETLARFPKTIQVAVEPRHDSWWTDETRSVLERHNAALCWADRKNRILNPLWRTADFGYLRLHDGTSRRPMSYGTRAIDSWLRRLSEFYDDSCDVYIYFNNDPGCAAIDNAFTMIRRAQRLGLAVKTVER
ncbi:DUF72 domain-containing protein [Gordonia terrae]|uniref:DUF72 domain-containing protein n=2 Tax=Gordonia terrae TaxID=2055 RepID=A0AAD0NTX6_9ACTN|nr:DUF72 domain-containing protein [Gordonia terrae]VTR08704.1 Protein of uncharacterised function DUF72 [Clostridioides difficile]ANY21479.1 histidine kinase [Gordonia terrae]AWO82206.1 DUF72 domain-containing protein [Gordonia terrae]VTS15842.1 Protein of uncharacterised function DUF72 [Gordonia terrae]GAB44012.1 hypothetical protein GOTRE_055_00240 [Gordonia terrae NBRC 100016]